MKAGDVVHFRHPQTGKQGAGTFTREFPEHNAVGVDVPGHREVVVHRDNPMETTTHE